MHGCEADIEQRHHLAVAVAHAIAAKNNADQAMTITLGRSNEIEAG